MPAATAQSRWPWLERSRRPNTRNAQTPRSISEDVESRRKAFYLFTILNCRQDGSHTTPTHTMRAVCGARKSARPHRALQALRVSYLRQATDWAVSQMHPETPRLADICRFNERSTQLAACSVGDLCRDRVKHRGRSSRT